MRQISKIHVHGSIASCRFVVSSHSPEEVNSRACHENLALKLANASGLCLPLCRPNELTSALSRLLCLGNIPTPAALALALALTVPFMVLPGPEPAPGDDTPDALDPIAPPVEGLLRNGFRFIATVGMVTLRFPPLTVATAPGGEAEVEELASSGLGLD